MKPAKLGEILGTVAFFVFLLFLLVFMGAPVLVSGIFSIRGAMGWARQQEIEKSVGEKEWHSYNEQTSDLARKLYVLHVESQKLNEEIAKSSEKVQGDKKLINNLLKQIQIYRTIAATGPQTQSAYISAMRASEKISEDKADLRFWIGIPASAIFGYFFPSILRALKRCFGFFRRARQARR